VEPPTRAVRRLLGDRRPVAGFAIDGEPFRIISGDVHEFRIHPEHWADPLRKARLVSLNTIDTYVPWDLYEARAGEWLFDGLLDL
jgi:beta-galactosidase